MSLKNLSINHVMPVNQELNSAVLKRVIFLFIYLFFVIVDGNFFFDFLKSLYLNFRF